MHVAAKLAIATGVGVATGITIGRAHEAIAPDRQLSMNHGAGVTSLGIVLGSANLGKMLATNVAGPLGMSAVGIGAAAAAYGAVQMLNTR